MRNLAILAALALAGCSIGAISDRNNFKGQPLSAVIAQLGSPDRQETIAGQKTYTWRQGGHALNQCRIRVVMAGDVVESYETSGGVNFCDQYEPSVR